MNNNSYRLPRQPVRPVWSRDRLFHERAVALECAVEASSSSAYSSALASYLTFCTTHNFPFDPTAETLSYYVVYMSRFIKPSSVESYLSGISRKLFPYFPSVRSSRRNEIVVETLRGCRKQFSSPIRRAPPLLVDSLITFLDSVSNPSHDDCLFIAILVSGFHALMRLGELVLPDNRRLQDFRKISLRNSVNILPSAVSFTLPYHKADRFFQGSRILVHKLHPRLDPLPFLTTYLRSRDFMFPLRLELWLTSDGSVPTRNWFMSRFHAVFPHDLTGHSLRAGGATMLACLGVPFQIIQAMGRWSSDTWQIYIREHPAILAAACTAHRETDHR
jgi:hypothetical protein